MRHITFLIICIALFSCQNSKSKTGKTDSAIISNPNDTSVITTVTYSGTLPCADCEGIITDLTLTTNTDNKDYHFSMKETYLGKNQSFPSEGNFAVLQGTPADPAATIIQLNPDKDKNLQRYFKKVSENELKLLDSEMKTIESNHNYSLKKVQ
ncbi:copper resistance protein NlpE [Chitinophaga silvatica]|uniref:Copper resistance protein NlpE n=1 Tax=Chitinophaga silvatica TaxID=2282649 RepID=A0A3E1YBZ7_9BACT|nr:copper resistance protein NlpE [Chitinophaga silvatica]RFS23501.1 copper resistance protein NlpE [Chitinophaga silvatica]